MASFSREQITFFSHFHANNILKTGTYWVLTQSPYSPHPISLNQITFVFITVVGGA